MGKVVLIEAPYKGIGSVERSRAYLTACMLDCFVRGETPIAPHAMYHAVFPEGTLEARTIVRMAGDAIAELEGVRVVAYTDLGKTASMYWREVQEERKLAGAAKQLWEDYDHNR